MITTPPTPAAATANTKQANPRIGPKSSSCITSWLRPKAKRHRLEMDPEPACLHIQELLSWLIPTLVFRHILRVLKRRHLEVRRRRFSPSETNCRPWMQRPGKPPTRQIRGLNQRPFADERVDECQYVGVTQHINWMRKIKPGWNVEEIWCVFHRKSAWC